MPTEPEPPFFDRYADLKAFVAEWHRPIALGDGYTEAEIAEAEARLGLRLPEALRELYALIGKRRDFFQEPDGTVSYDTALQLETIDKTDKWLVINGDRNYGWGISAGDWHQTNPLLHSVEAEEIEEYFDDPAPVSLCFARLIARQTMMAGSITAIGFAGSSYEPKPGLIESVLVRSSPTTYQDLNIGNFCCLDGMLAQWQPWRLDLLAKNVDNLLNATERYNTLSWYFPSLEIRQMYESRQNPKDT